LWHSCQLPWHFAHSCLLCQYLCHCIGSVCIFFLGFSAKQAVVQSGGVLDEVAAELVIVLSSISSDRDAIVGQVSVFMFVGGICNGHSYQVIH